MSKAGGRAGADLVRIFEGGSAAGLTDGELLGRFADRGDPAAFEALVARLGPMVLGACRRMLVDPHDVDDAFQATFLVLVRKARAIGRRELVGPWLHAVAVRTARRARVNSARRSARERLAVVREAQGGDAEIASHWPELRAAIDEEIGRLPEHHRRAVVLCDVEGLSREEAAERLGWTPNMVRGRLERARARLRNRLARRGLAPSGVWPALFLKPPAFSPALVASTARAALSLSAGRIGTGLASASAVALSQGVLNMMMISKLASGLAVAVSVGVVAAGSGMIAAQGPGDGSILKGAVPVVEPSPTGKRPLADITKTRVDAARQRLEAQRAFYEEGRITVDRYLDALTSLMTAERDAAGSKTQRLAAVQSYVAGVRQVQSREEAEFKKGRAATSDLTEIEQLLSYAEAELAKEPTPTDPEGMKLARTARLRWVAQKTSFQEGRISVDRLLDGSRQVMLADRRIADSKDDELEAIRAHIDRLKQVRGRAESELKAGRATTGDVLEIDSYLADAEYILAVETLSIGSQSPDPRSPGDSPTSSSKGSANGLQPALALERRISEVEKKLDRLINLLDGAANKR